MKRLILLLHFVLLLGLAGVSTVFAQSGSAPAPAGTEFYVAFPPNEDARGGSPVRYLGLLATAPYATTMQVEIPTSDGGVSVRSYDLFPGQITEVPVADRGFMEPRISEEMSATAVHVRSRAPIVLYAVNGRYQSYGTWAVQPVDRWGTSAMTVTLPNADGERTGQISVIAAQDSTSLVIRPSVQTYRQDAGRDITVYLNRGQTFLVQARPGAGGDLSGTEILEASQPVGIVAGHVRAPVGSSSTTAWASHLGMMLTPEADLGSDYTTVPTRSDRSDLYRVVGVAPGTLITMRHYPPGGSAQTQQITVGRGDVVDVTSINGSAITGPVRWSATGPFELVQFRQSGLYANPADAPVMIPILSTDRFGTLAATVAPETLGSDLIGTHTMNIVISLPVGGTLDRALRAVSLDGITLDALRSTATVQSFDNGRSVAVRLPVSSGGHTLRSDADHPFGATLIGGSDPVSRAFYGWVVSPVTVTDIDRDPPFLVSSVKLSGRRVRATFSDDRSPGYFSGLWSIRPVDPAAWEMVGTFTPGAPEQEGTVEFRPLADPSGPLDVEIADRDGNRDTVRLTESLCASTATLAPGVDTLRILVHANELPARVPAVVAANVCGDAAEIRGTSLSGGNGASYLTASTATPTVSIAPYGSDTVWVATGATLAVGEYRTTLRVDIDGVVQTVPVFLDVEEVAGVDHPGVLATISVTPNPAPGVATVHFPTPLGSNATVRLIDARGAVALAFDGAELTGRTSLALGEHLAAGNYRLVVTERGETRTIPVRLVR